MGTEAIRRIYGTGGDPQNQLQRDRFYVTIPTPWLRSIEKAHGRPLKVFTATMYTDRLVLRPLWADIVPTGDPRFLPVRVFKKCKAVQLPLVWLRSIGFIITKHGRRKPRPTPFKVIVETTDDNELHIRKIEGQNEKKEGQNEGIEGQNESHESQAP